MLEIVDLVFYSQLLALEVADRLGVRQWAADFLVKLTFEVSVPGAERFDTILQRH